MTDHDTPAHHVGSACRDGCWSCLFWGSTTLDGMTNAICDNELSPRFGTLTAAEETCRVQADVGGR